MIPKLKDADQQASTVEPAKVKPQGFRESQINAPGQPNYNAQSIRDLNKSIPK